jgi:hypothetical protein
MRTLGMKPTPVPRSGSRENPPLTHAMAATLGALAAAYQCASIDPLLNPLR